jgi:hypothetical protein
MPGSADDALSAWLAARVEATLDAEALAAGTGELHVGLVPLENPEGGQASWTVEVNARHPG